MKDVRDSTHDSPKYHNEGHPLVTSKNLTNHGLDMTDVSLISDEDFEAINQLSKVDIGDIIFGIIGIIGNLVILDRDDFAIKNVALLKNGGEVDNTFLIQLLKLPVFDRYMRKENAGGTQKFLGLSQIRNFEFLTPTMDAQLKIGEFFGSLDHLIPFFSVSHKSNSQEDKIMLDETIKTELFHVYYKRWITVYKEGAIRKVTMAKYLMTHQWLVKLVPNLKLCDLTRISYQQLLNDYAQEHERQTTMDFHHQLKGAILDAVDEGFIDRDPTRKAIIKGKTPREKKPKYLNQFELHTMLANLNLSQDINWDWFILLVAKTGMRFSEALALTPKDFDFAHQMLSINKTWDYKANGGFLPTKNQSSVRKIQLDWQTVIQFSELLKGLPEDKPIFVYTKGKIYNSTVNGILARVCKKSKVPTITIHGLRHTHASLLLFAGVSIASVARRLGHASMTTTQKTYLHIIQELENKDVDLIMRSLSGLS